MMGNYPESNYLVFIVSVAQMSYPDGIGLISCTTINPHWSRRTIGQERFHPNDSVEIIDAP
jgi:hypothetical protein